MSPLVDLLVGATVETAAMVGVASTLALLLGLPLGVLLVVTAADGLRPLPLLNRGLGTVVNVGRSFPFIILLVALTPLTRLVVGTTLGWTAATVPLSVGAIPFFARLAETALREVAPGKVEAALAMGSTTRHVITKVLVPESLGSIVAGLTVTVIALIGYSAMAGAIGGGGLGDVAIRYGYQRFQTDVMASTVVLLILLVQIVQVAGDRLSRRVQHH